MPTSSVESERLVDACFNKTLSNCLLKTVSLKNRYKKIYIQVKKKSKIYCAVRRYDKHIKNGTLGILSRVKVCSQGVL